MSLIRPSDVRRAAPPATRFAYRSLVALLLLTVPVACSTEATGPGGGAEGRDVTSVVVTGVPTTTVLVGDTLRLVATAVNATGGVVSNQRVTWKSSAPAVVAVRENGTAIALGGGHATVTASVAGREGSVALDVADGVTFGTAGGTLRAAGGAAVLVLPGNALARPTLVTMRPASNAPADPRVVPNTAYALGPDDLRFWGGGTLTLAFDPARLPEGVAGESLQLYAQEGAAWAVVPRSTVDRAAHTVSGVVAGAGVYAVRSTLVDRVVLSGAAAGGALYVGQVATLGATLYATAADTLPSRQVAWTSSDPGKVAVDAAGRVTAVAAGTATLTAAVDGTTASTTVTVLVRPTADWSRAGEWTTYQGNPQHSGYVNATVDPAAFRERWVATPAAGATYDQPTTGGGRLYLARNGYFSTNQLVALNPASGAQLWVRDFGAIFGINQATYHDGAVYLTSGGHEDTFLWALRAGDGTLRYQAPFHSQWEHWKAPVVAGTTIATAGGYYGGMYGFDLATGKQLYFRDGAQVDGWAPAAGSDGRLYLTDGGVRALDPATGAVLSEMSDARVRAVVTPVAGGAHNLLTIIGNRLVSTDVAAMTVAWEQSGGYVGMPVVANGVVYAAGSDGITARRESDGALLWSWALSDPYKPASYGGGAPALAVTNNVLFVSLSAYGEPGVTVALDLAGHLPVWSYPMGGAMALSGEGVLYLVQGDKVAAVAVR